MTNDIDKGKTRSHGTDGVTQKLACATFEGEASNLTLCSESSSRKLGRNVPCIDKKRKNPHLVLKYAICYQRNLTPVPGTHLRSAVLMTSSVDQLPLIYWFYGVAHNKNVDP